MSDYVNADIGISFPLYGLHVANENEGWVALKKDISHEAFISIFFANHFFNKTEECESFIQTELQKVADANDLHQLVGINKQSNETVTGCWSQYINNVTHLVYAAFRVLPGYKGFYYMAVTNSDELSQYCESIFLNTKQIAKAELGPIDDTTERKLANHTLKYFHGYNSNWGAGGGSSTQQSFTLHADHSFRYSYSSVMSFGSMGGSTSQDEGWGMWEVQNNNGNSVLILRWHLKAVTAYPLQWGEPGIVYLGDEKYIVD